MVVAGCWGGGRWVENLVCLGCLCDVGFGGVGFFVVVRLLVRGVSEGIREDLVWGC
jgi:hypothetical protein